MSSSLNSTENELGADGALAPWTPKSIKVSAELRNTVTGERTACEINLVDYMGVNSAVHKRLQSDSDFAAEGHRRPIIFPDITDCDEAARATLIGRLKILCAKEGFVLNSKGWEQQKMRSRFCCRRRKRALQSVTREAQKEAQKAEGEAVNNKTCSKCCKFGFQLSFKPIQRAWMFETGSGTPLHSFHEKLSEAEIDLPAKYRDNSALKVQSAMACNASPPATQAFSIGDKTTEERKAFETWKDPNYSSEQAFAPLIQELCAAADRSFQVHEYVRRELVKMLRTVKEIRNNEDNATTKRCKSDPVEAHERDRPEANSNDDEEQFVSSFFKGDRSGQSKHPPANTNNGRPRTKKATLWQC